MTETNNCVCVSCRNQNVCLGFVCSCGHLHWRSPVFKKLYNAGLFDNCDGTAMYRPLEPEQCFGYVKAELGKVPCDSCLHHAWCDQPDSGYGCDSYIEE